MKTIKTLPILLIALSPLIACEKDDGNDEITVADIDGNVYHTVTVGTQVWMVENLKTTKYNDGTEIPLVTGTSEWMNIHTPAYCWYDNDDSNKNPYGALYNWYAVNTGKLAPDGWHVPTQAEWLTLMEFIGGEEADAGKVKEEGTAHWNSPNTGATNETGLTLLPGGRRFKTGVFDLKGSQGFYYAFEEGNSGDGRGYVFFYNISNFGVMVDLKTIGFSVRCIKD